MSVGRSGDVHSGLAGDVAEWYDFEHEVKQLSVIVESGDISGQPWRIEGNPHGEPAGGLDRDELAELYGMTINQFRATVEPSGNAGTTPGRVVFEIELNKNGEPSTTTTEDESSNVSGTNVSNGFERVQRKQADALFWEAETEAVQAFNDTTNGTGGQGGPNSGSHFQQVVNFRKLYGRGPLFEDDDDVTFGYALTGNQVANEDAEGKFWCTLHWIVHEVEDRFELV